MCVIIKRVKILFLSSRIISITISFVKMAHYRSPNSLLYYYYILYLLISIFFAKIHRQFYTWHSWGLTRRFICGIFTSFLHDTCRHFDSFLICFDSIFQTSSQGIALTHDTFEIIWPSLANAGQFIECLFMQNQSEFTGFLDFFWNQKMANQYWNEEYDQLIRSSVFSRFRRQIWRADQNFDQVNTF